MSHEQCRAWLQAVLPLQDDTGDQAVITAWLRLHALAEEAGAYVQGRVDVDLSRRGTQMPGWEHWDGPVAVATAIGALASGVAFEAAAYIDDRTAAVDPDRYDRDTIDLRLKGVDVVLSVREYAAAAREILRRHRGDREALARVLTRPGLTVTAIPAHTAGADRLVLAS